MGRRSALVSVFVVTVIGLCPCAFGDLIAFSYTDWALYKLGPTTLHTSKIGELTIPRSADLACMAGAGPGQAYMVGRAQNVLYTVSLSDASVIASVTLDRDMEVNGRGLDLSPTGNLYGVFAGRDLRSINPLTGQTTLQVQIDSGNVESIVFSPDGTLYAATDAGALSVVDFETGLLDMVANLGDLDPDAAAWFDGYVYAADSQAGVIADLYRIDPRTGSVLNLGSTGIVELNGLMAVDPTVVPLPSAILLAMLGLGYSGWRVRRKPL